MGLFNKSLSSQRRGSDSPFNLICPLLVVCRENDYKCFLSLNQCHLHITLTIYLNVLSLVIVYKIYPYYLLGSALPLLSVYCCTYSLLSLIVLYLSHFIFGHMLHLHMYLIFNDLFSHFPYLFFYLFLLTFGLLFNSFFSVASIPQRGIVKSRMNLIRIFKSREIDRYAFFMGTRPKQIYFKQLNNTCNCN